MQRENLKSNQKKGGRVKILKKQQQLHYKQTSV